MQYDRPPISFDGSAVGIPDLDGFQLRFRAYDYGVISLALSKPFAGDWPELLGIGQGLMESPELEQRAEGVCRHLMNRIHPALLGLRPTLLSLFSTGCALAALGC